MSVQPTDDGEYVTVGVDAREGEIERYDHVDLEDGRILVYDREEEDAWIQADFAVGLDAMV